MLRARPATLFVIAGSGPDSAAIAGAIADRGLSASMRMLGHVDPGLALSATDLVAFPSRFEWPAAGGARSSGDRSRGDCVLVAHGLRALWPARWRVPAGDPGALAAGLIGLLDSSDDALAAGVRELRDAAWRLTTDDCSAPVAEVISPSSCPPPMSRSTPIAARAGLATAAAGGARRGSCRRSAAPPPDARGLSHPAGFALLAVAATLRPALPVAAWLAGRSTVLGVPSVFGALADLRAETRDLDLVAEPFRALSLAAATRRRDGLDPMMIAAVGHAAQITALGRARRARPGRCGGVVRGVGALAPGAGVLARRRAPGARGGGGRLRRAGRGGGAVRARRPRPRHAVRRGEVVLEGGSISRARPHRDAGFRALDRRTARAGPARPRASLPPGLLLLYLVVPVPTGQRTFAFESAAVVGLTFVVAGVGNARGRGSWRRWRCAACCSSSRRRRATSCSPPIA